jgi:hypothetical protein
MMLYFVLMLYFVVQPAFDLLSREEVEALFLGGAGYGPPSTLQLRRSATYELPLTPEDAHIVVSSI